MTELPTHIRPITFAMTELILDLVHTLQAHHKVDLESLMILLRTQDATMRPFVLDPNTPHDVLHSATPPDGIRGSISRRMIADKTGLPRETVRRKTADLADKGWLVIDDGDRLRVPSRLATPESQAVVEAGHKAVVRYVDRLKALGVDWENVPVKP